MDMGCACGKQRRSRDSGKGGQKSWQTDLMSRQFTKQKGGGSQSSRSSQGSRGSKFSGSRSSGSRSTTRGGLL